MQPLLSAPDIEVNRANNDGMTPLHIASAMGHEKVVLALLNVKDTEVNSEDNHGTTPLQWASNYGKLKVVQVGNSIGFLDRLTDRLKMGDGLKMSDFGLGMS